MEGGPEEQSSRGEFCFDTAVPDWHGSVAERGDSSRGKAIRLRPLIVSIVAVKRRIGWN